MNKLMAGSIATALFLLAGCGARGPKLASSAEDIVGTWQSTTSSAELQFNEDGTLRIQFEGGVIVNAKFRFEGTRFFDIDSSLKPSIAFRPARGVGCSELLASHKIFAQI